MMMRMKNKLLRSSFYIAAPAAILGVAFIVGLWSYSRATGDEITVCVKRNGMVYVIGEGFKNAKCQKNETLLSWNIQGPPGPSGNALHLHDGGGQDLGLLLNMDMYDEPLNLSITPTQPTDIKTYRTFHPAFGVELFFDVRTRSKDVRLALPLNGGVYFEGADCTGAVFSLDRTDRISVGPHVFIKATGPRYFRYAGGPTARTGASYLPEAFGSPCVNTSTSTPNAIDLEEVSPSFTEPLAWPPVIASE